MEYLQYGGKSSLKLPVLFPYENGNSVERGIKFSERPLSQNPYLAIFSPKRKLFSCLPRHKRSLSFSNGLRDCSARSNIILLAFCHCCSAFGLPCVQYGLPDVDPISQSFERIQILPKGDVHPKIEQYASQHPGIQG